MVITMTRHDAEIYTIDFLEKHNINEDNFPFNIKILSRMEDAFNVRNEDDKKIKGGILYPKNIIFIVSDNHKNQNDLIQTLQHEIFGHIAINYLSPDQKNSLLKSIEYESKRDSCDFLDIATKLNNDWHYSKISTLQRAEELFAYIAENTSVNPNYKFTPFENKLDGNTKKKIENIIQNLAAGRRENKLTLQQDNFIQKSQDKGMSR